MGGLDCGWLCGWKVRGGRRVAEEENLRRMEICGGGELRWTPGAVESEYGRWAQTSAGSGGISYVSENDENGGKWNLLHALQSSNPGQRGTEDISDSAELAGFALQALRIIKGEREYYAGIGLGFVVLLDTHTVLKRIMEMRCFVQSICKVLFL